MATTLLQVINVVPRLLAFAGLLTALIFAIARRGILRGAATPAITGISLLLANAVLGISIQLLVNAGYIHHMSLPQGDYTAFLALLNGVSGLVWVAGTGLLIVAVFIGRTVVTPDPDQTCSPAGPLV